MVEVKALACELPRTLGVPLSRLHIPDLRKEILRRGLVAEISGATIWRWLDADALRPWTHRSWIFPRDPEFSRKAGRVLDLYARTWDHQRLRSDEYVISADEKTSIQARCRCHPTLPPAQARRMRVEHEYARGELSPIWPSGMSTEPYASTHRVFWVVDNGSTHRGQAAVKRLEGQWHNLRLVHLPLHAS